MCLQEVIEAAHQDHYPTMLRLGLLSTQQERLVEAVEWLEKAAAANPDAVAPRLLLGRLFLEEGDFQRVLQETEGPLEKNPNDRGLLTLFGSAKLSLGQGEEAAETFERLVEVVPNVAEAHFLLAAAYAQLGKQSELRKELETTLEIDPEHFKARLTFARFLLSENDLTTAKTFVEELAQSHPNDFDVLNLRADVALREGKPDEALKHLNVVHNLAKTSDSALALALGQWQSGDREASVATLESWLEGSPKDARIRLYLGQYYLALGREEAGLKQYLTLVEDQPDSWLALNQAAWLLNKKGEHDAALGYAEQAYELAPNNPNVADTLAVILVGRDEVKRALPLLAKATTQAPKNADIAFHYADALAKSGKTGEAEAILEGILAQEAPFEERDAAESLLGDLRAN